jgi:nucleoside-diphosphate-sugar epimerase
MADKTDKRNRTVLITGGLGNLGSWLTEHFVGRGYKVTVLASRRRPILPDLDFEFLVCDIADEKACAEALGGRSFDVVIHAASVNDGFVPGYPELALRVNAWGTRNILEAMKDRPPGHFIYLSTFQVYGKYAGDISEQTPLETRNDYGLSHLFAEFYVKQYGFTHKLPYTIIRLTNSYGAPKDQDSSKWYLVLNDLSRSALRDKKIQLNSNGQAPRDFIWMGDVCDVMERLAEQGATQDIFNLSGELSFRMVEIAEFVQRAYEEVYGARLPVVTNENDKSTFPDGFSVSSAKLKKLVPYECRPHFVEEAKKIFELLEKES